MMLNVEKIQVKCISKTYTTTVKQFEVGKKFWKEIHTFI